MPFNGLRVSAALVRLCGECVKLAHADSLQTQCALAQVRLKRVVAQQQSSGRHDGPCIVQRLERRSIRLDRKTPLGQNGIDLCFIHHGELLVDDGAMIHHIATHPHRPATTAWVGQ